MPYVGILSLAAVTLLLAQFDFTTLVMAEVVFMLALYMILPMAVLKLRKTMPLSQRGDCYHIGGGKAGLYFCTLLPLIIAIGALLINGTDYFLIGLIGISTGPIFYMIFKWTMGGLAKNDPVKYPLDPKTKLAKGDITRLGIYCTLAGVFALVGRVFLQWYEGEDGVEYYAEEAESALFSNFNGMLMALLIGGIVVLALGLILLAAGKKRDKTL